MWHCYEMRISSSKILTTSSNVLLSVRTCDEQLTLVQSVTSCCVNPLKLYVALLTNIVQRDIFSVTGTTSHLLAFTAGALAMQFVSCLTVNTQAFKAGGTGFGIALKVVASFRLKLATVVVDRI